MASLRLFGIGICVEHDARQAHLPFHSRRLLPSPVLFGLLQGPYILFYITGASPRLDE
ncbi:hypothetical protein HPP92_018097 [Vanilla planifolia]|uniref:Uncharacterized protein n=1 Tax=Vanilla planifolia TaxID=51239 RepID=A0A835QAH5_VANPL|nr:hypothetical protein HPP92_018097 [Vanilla planifolia]